MDAPQTLHDVLHNVLDYVNTLQLKEGLLVNVSNKLKNAFEASPSAPTVAEHPINAKLLFSGVTVHVTKMVNVKIPNKFHPNVSDDNVHIHFTVSNEKGMKEKIVPQRFDEPY